MPSAPPAPTPTPPTPDPAPEPVYQVVYASAATKPMGQDELEKLLATARKKNARLGLTGVLLYHEGSFLQALEGDRHRVEAVYEKIGRDGRHGDLMLLFRGEVEERSFADWSMGYVRLDARQARAIPGFSAFLERRRAGVEGAIGEDAVVKVLEGFRAGKWRRAAA